MHSKEDVERLVMNKISHGDDVFIGHDSSDRLYPDLVNMNAYEDEEEVQNSLRMDNVSPKPQSTIDI